MKKIIIFILTIFLLTGCNNKLLNTPTKKVEMFFEKYQSLDQDVLDQLNNVVNNEISFTDDQREKYKEIMKKHYQSLKYEIKDETIDGNIATVTVQIEVIDYSKILEQADKYKEENKNEFLDKDGEYDQTKFNEYRIDKLLDANKTVTYTIELSLTNIDGEWILDDLSSENEDKIRGIYKY